MGCIHSYTCVVRVSVKGSFNKRVVQVFLLKEGAVGINSALRAVQRTVHSVLHGMNSACGWGQFIYIDLRYRVWYSGSLICHTIEMNMINLLRGLYVG